MTTRKTTNCQCIGCRSINIHSGKPVQCFAKAPKPPRKCIDCGRIHNNQKCKRCAACHDFVKAFTENKHGELA